MQTVFTKKVRHKEEKQRERKREARDCVVTGVGSHLNVEAETSVLVRSHLDQDQIIVRDDTI